MTAPGHPESIRRRVLRRVWSPQLENERDLDVYLPPSYSRTRRRYPVVYMQDGQNLADPDRSFAGTWGLPSALARLASRGIEAIVVGVPHMGQARPNEYSPFHDERHGGARGDAYLAFLERTIKPLVDARFRTRPERESTVVLGSSMGALISLYAFFRAPETFGRAGALSPAAWFAGRALAAYIDRAGAPPGRLYLDVGSHEGAGTLRDAAQLARILERKGYRGETLQFTEDPEGRHEEACWGRRLVPALEFLLRNREANAARRRHPDRSV